MAEVLAAAGIGSSFIALIELGAEILALCHKYYQEVKDARETVDALVKEIKTLQEVLKQVEAVANTSMGSKLLATRATVELRDACLAKLKEIIIKLDVDKNKSRMRKLGLRSLRWPFKKDEVERITKAIQRYTAVFNFAISADILATATDNL